MKTKKPKAKHIPTNLTGTVIYQAHQNKEGKMKISLDLPSIKNGKTSMDTIEDDPKNFILIND